MLSRVVSAIFARPLIFSCLAVILLFSAYFRLWNLNDSFHFLGDQGRDALVVSRMFTEKDLVFIGPVTSVGNMYLGPFYYYFMLPFLFISYPSPVGPVYAVALVNLLTVYLLYRWGKELVGTRAALLAAGLMGFSVTAIIFSRFSWNPNILPFVSLALIFATFQAWQKNPKYWLWVGVWFSLIIQLHYVALLSGVAAGVIWLVQLYQHRTHKTELKKIVLFGVGALIITVLSLLPLMLFDYKHGWTNTKAFSRLLNNEENFVQRDLGTELLSIGRILSESHGRSMHILFEITIGKNRSLNTALLILVITILALYIKRFTGKLQKISGLLLLVAFLLVGIIGLSFYQHTVFNHYIAFLFPVTFLLLGFCLDQLLKIKFIGWLPVLIFIGFYLNYNWREIKFGPGGPTQSQLRATAEAIHQRLEPNQPYSIVLLSDSGDLYGMNYRYFLSTNPDKKPLNPEDHHQAEKMFIINEDLKSDSPQDLPIYEIVVFENKQPQEVFTMPHGIEITVLSKDGE